MPSQRFFSVFTLLSASLLSVALPVGFPHGTAYALTAPGDQPTPDENQQKSGETPNSGITGGQEGLPMPDSLLGKPATGGQSTEGKDEKSPPTEFVYDLSTLPEPVKKMRAAIVEAAASGEVERLRPLLSGGSDPTQIAVGDAPEDPIAALKSLSGDKEGRELLGILLDIISTGAAHVDKGTPNEMYVWPYFVEKPLDQLTPPEQVDLYRIVTAADVADMKEFGGYNFYRIGISPDGKWKFFVAGD